MNNLDLFEIESIREIAKQPFFILSRRIRISMKTNPRLCH